MLLVLRERGRNAAAIPAMLLLVLFLSLQPASMQFTVTPPSEVRVNETDSVTVNCSFPNADALSWRFEGVTIEASNPAFSLGSASGDAISLTIPSADHAVHSGTFVCEAVVGPTVSTAGFEIIVQYLDSAVQIRLINDVCSEPGIIFVNTNISLECTPAGGVPPPRISWFKDTTKIRQTDSLRYEFDNNKQIFRINNIEVGDSDLYHCAANNDIAPEATSIDFEINVRTMVDTRVTLLNALETVFVREGSEATLDCHVTPAPSSSAVRWRRNSNVLTSGDGGFALFTSPCDFTLHITRVEPSHEGSYTCEVGEVQDTTRISIARLNSDYEVHSSTGTFMVGRGRGLQLECVGTGDRKSVV